MTVHTAAVTWTNGGTTETYYFASPDGETYIEVWSLGELSVPELRRLMDGETKDGRTTRPMLVARRYLEMQDEYPERSVRFSE